ncbi:unnamed protein product, partial [Bubo scandiacus]
MATACRRARGATKATPASTRPTASGWWRWKEVNNMATYSTAGPRPTQDGCAASPPPRGWWRPRCGPSTPSCRGATPGGRRCGRPSAITSPGGPCASTAAGPAPAAILWGLANAAAPPMPPSPPSAAPRRRGAARLSVWVRGGRGWRGDHFSPTDAYVRVIFAGRQVQTATAWNDERPRWGARFDWGTVALPPGARLRVEVWDEDNKWDDDLLGVCEEPLEAGGTRDVVCFPGGGAWSSATGRPADPPWGAPLPRLRAAAPENDGGLLRASRWPPGPQTDPWPGPTKTKKKRRRRRKATAILKPSGGPPGRRLLRGPPGVGFWGPPGDPLEPTDAFGDLPEPLGGLGRVLGGGAVLGLWGGASSPI